MVIFLTQHPQIDALIAHGVMHDKIYSDYASGKYDEHQGLLACFKALKRYDL